MQVLNLMREFELQKMKESKTIKGYPNKLMGVANKIKLLGTNFTDSKIVEIIIAIRRPNQHYSRMSQPPFRCWKSLDAKCSKRNQMGHETTICKDKEEEQLFVTTCFSSNSTCESWLIDSGCTIHMTYDKELFKQLESTKVKWVKIGNDEHIPVKGKGTIAIISYSCTKILTDILYTIFPITTNSIDLWHKRLGHFHHLGMSCMLKNQLVRRVPSLSKKLSKCEACQFRKQTQKSFLESSWRASQKL
ncbi:hypothetical protein CR513_14575, partial [Mucuna pruriens]